LRVLGTSLHELAQKSRPAGLNPSLWGAEDATVTQSNDHIRVVKQAIVDGDSESASLCTEAAIAAGLDPQVILDQALMAGTTIVGEQFEKGVFFLPELMLTGKALKAAMTVLAPALKAKVAHNQPGATVGGTIVIATVQTDIHDIGKNIVAAMLAATGFQVHDMGVDVPTKAIVARAQEVNADIIACSALLTTSMPVMRDLIGILNDNGLRERFKVMIGGAPITEDFVKEIGADGTARNAIAAARLATHLVTAHRNARAMG